MANKRSSARMPNADSGASTRARKSKPRRSRSPRRQSSRQLPPPVDVQNPEPAGQPRTDANSGGSLLDGLKSAFGLNTSENSSSPEAKDFSSDFRQEPATSGTGELLSPEAEAQLNAVPDVIGAGAPESPSGDAPAPALGSDEIAGFMEAIAFEEQDVKDVLGELFDWLATRFDSDHWRLTDRQMRILGKPTAQLLNSVWAKLRDRLPDILARWCETTPGAAAFLTAAGIVVVPKVMTQVRLSRGAKRAASPASEAERQPAERAAAPRKSPMPYREGPAIPAFGGIVK